MSLAAIKETDLVPIKEFAEECNLVSLRTLRRYAERAEEIGMEGVFYQFVPRGALFVHRPSWQAWIAERKVVRPGTRPVR